MPTTTKEPVKLCELQYPLCMAVGGKLERGFRFKDKDKQIINLSGYEAIIQIREKLNNPIPMITLDSREVSPFGSTLEILPDEGTILMKIHNNETEEWIDISKEKGCFWDLRLIEPSGAATVYFRASPFTLQPVSTRKTPEIVIEP